MTVKGADIAMAGGPKSANSREATVRFQFELARQPDYGSNELVALDRRHDVMADQEFVGARELSEESRICIEPDHFWVDHPCFLGSLSSILGPLSTIGVSTDLMQCDSPNRSANVTKYYDHKYS